MPTLFWDDPAKDFRTRYQMPEHFTWDPDDLPMIEYAGYISIVSQLLPPPPCQILDVGCGDGWVGKRLLDLGYQEICGVDYSERAVAFARIMAPGGQFHVGDIRDLERAVNSKHDFDVALCIEVLEHIPLEYHPLALAQIGNCLKNQGLLILTLPSINIPLHRWHYKHFDVDEGKALLEAHGFRVYRIINQGHLSPLFSPRLWRYLRNRYYDLRGVRRALGDMFLRKLNQTSDPAKARRYIYCARKESTACAAS